MSETTRGAETMEPEKEDPREAKESARIEIELVRQMVARFGNNDKEFDALDDIKIRMDGGEITPKEAMGQAWEVYNNKCEPQ